MVGKGLCCDVYAPSGRLCEDEEKEQEAEEEERRRSRRTRVRTSEQLKEASGHKALATRMPSPKFHQGSEVARSLH